MKKGHTLGIALATGLMFCGSAYADLIDGFGDDQGPVTDSTADATDVSDGPVAITDTDLTNAMRTITVNLSSTDGLGATNQILAGTGGGAYEHSQTSGETGWSQVDWTFDSIALSDPINLLVSVIDIDLSADIVLTLTDGSAASQSDSATVNAIGVYVFSFGFGAIDMSDIVAASLYIDGTGTESLDLSLDFVATRVPEPATLSLLGGGVLALGFFGGLRRRRLSVTS